MPTNFNWIINLEIISWRLECFMRTHNQWCDTCDNLLPQQSISRIQGASPRWTLQDMLNQSSRRIRKIFWRYFSILFQTYIWKYWRYFQDIWFILEISGYMIYQSSSLGGLEVSPVLLVIHLEGHIVLLENRVSQILMFNHRLHNEMAIFGGTPVYPIVTDQCLNHDQMHIPCDNTKQPKNTNLSIKCAHLSENLWVNLWENLEVASVLGGCTNGWTNPLVLMIIHLLGYRNMYNVAMTVCVHLQRKCIN
jgi:hypothetical protein